MTILHICPLDKFLPPFIEFVRKNIGIEDQLFFTYRSIKKYPYTPGPDAMHRDGKFSRYFSMFCQMYKSERIILHGLFDKFLVAGLFFQPWLLKKCFWLIWGYDLYIYEKAPRTFEWKIREFFRRNVIKKMGFLVTSVDGDYQKAVEWYRPAGKRLAIYTYPASLYQELSSYQNDNNFVKILLGNSADPSNNHEEALDKLAKFKDENIQIFCPLSYGNKTHADKIIKLGKDIFGNKFTPMTRFMKLDEYNKFLSGIDILVFNHDRQQGMSTVRVTLGMGKKVYLRDGISSYEMFQKNGIEIFPISDLNIDVDFHGKEKNIEQIRKSYSELALINNLKFLFNY